MPSLFPPLAALQARWSALRGDLHEMLELRLALVQLEVRVAMRQVTWLALAVSVFSVIGVAGASLFAVLAAEALSQWLAWTRPQAFLVVGAGLGLIGLLGILAAIRIFRRNFTGLETSVAELREDLVWLEEYRK